MAPKQQLNTRYIYALLQVPGIGRKMVQKILKTLPFSPTNIRDLQSGLEEINHSHPFITVPSIAELEFGLEAFDRLAEEAECAQVQIIGKSDPSFPDSLNYISDPPLILYVKGDATCLQSKLSIAVIGTRQPTEVGKERGHVLAQRLAEAGLIVVSGLAEGCDTVAHEGCLAAQGRTVAVMAHGLQMVYPASNRKLAEQIVDTGGCLVSEYRLGLKPFKSSFVERDRIQSGLSAAVVVIQTDIKGGTMHTVDFCLEQGKHLACLDFPPHKRSNQSRGNESLIARGKATPIGKREDIDPFIQQVYGDLLKSSATSSVELSQPIVLCLEKPEMQQVEMLDVASNKLQPLMLNLELNPAEQHKFMELCAASHKTPEAVVVELIRQYLNPDSALPESQTIAEQNDTIHEQLELTIGETRQSITEDEVKQSVRTSLTQKDLAARLKVEPETIRRRKSKPDFTSWSQERDPQKLSWEFSSETKKFYSF